jgi:hypothetical protein
MRRMRVMSALSIALTMSSTVCAQTMALEEGWEDDPLTTMKAQVQLVRARLLPGNTGNAPTVSHEKSHER